MKRMRYTDLHSLKRIYLFVAIQLVLTTAVRAQSFRDTDFPVEMRVELLIGELTLEEKVSLMESNSAAVERLDIPAYNWWSDGLHGLNRGASATLFPQVIGMAATFNPTLLEEVGTAISDEGRAIYHEAIRKGIRKQYLGLTYWCPSVNIFRDPRWGRGHETYGEDPFLAGLLSSSFVKGLQGYDESTLKVSACAKHFAVHNGPEGQRHTFNTTANPKDLHETYLPAFKNLVDAGVTGFMCAYNRFNGEACCGTLPLMVDILRNDWGFDGYMVSDCGALSNFHATHKVTENAEQSAAMAIKADVNVNCGSVYRNLQGAVEKELITEEELDAALSKQLKICFQLGMFDDEEKNSYATIPMSVVRSEEHINLTRRVARESIVLLKNENNVLPLIKDISQLYITGNNAANIDALMGNYYGVPREYVTVLEGIASAVSPISIVQYNKGFIAEQDLESLKTGQTWNARFADASIAVIGLSALYEGENGDTPFSKTGGNRAKIELPENQLEYLKKLGEQIGDKPLIVIVLSGSSIAMPEVHELADAILWAWYPGEQGGNAVADVLFGDYSPSGRLPITIYQSTSQLGDFEDYSIAEGGRTYRYFQGDPLYPFEFGLSYNKMNYKLVNDPELKMKTSGNLDIEADFITPLYAIKDIKKVNIQAGASTSVTFNLSGKILEQVNNEGNNVLSRGEYKVYIGTSSPSSRLPELGGLTSLELSVTVN